MGPPQLHTVIEGKTDRYKYISHTTACVKSLGSSCDHKCFAFENILLAQVSLFPTHHPSVYLELGNAKTAE
jgi:hypothetical protein